MRRISVLSAVLATVLAGLAARASAGDVVRFRVEDTIQPASQRYIERVLDQAAADHAELVVMELDTPGGLIDSTREITSAITSSKVPVAVYVTPAGARAASAGFFILISADIAAMTPGTNAGAAHPVGGQGEDIPGHMDQKVTNDAKKMIQSLAEARGRNTEKAVEGVEESSSYTATEALTFHLIDVIAKDVPDLLKQLDGKTIKRFDGTEVVLDLTDAHVVDVEPSTGEKIFSILANPNIAYLLMALGMLGIYVEITHPGAVLPGVVGVIAMLLALYSMSVLPVNMAGIALIVFGVILLVLEVKVASYGMLTVGGLTCFVLGSLMLFDSPIPALRVSLGVILPTALMVAVVVVFLLNRVVKAHSRKPATGVEGLVGEIGRVVKTLGPRGTVAVHGEWWDARTSGATVAEGDEVRVTAVSGRYLEVEPVENDAPADGE